MIDFDKLLEQAIQKEIETRKTRERSGKFSPSQMGKCFRAQYWHRLKEPETNPIPIEVYRKFRAGNIYHRDLQSLVTNVEVKYEDDNFIMFADHVVDDCVVDFKTVFSTQFKAMMNKSHEEICEDKIQYVMQLATYCHFLKKPNGLLVFVNKDDYTLLQVPVVYSEWKEKVEDEIEILMGYWNKKKLPPPLPRCYIGKGGKSKECEYCAYSIDGKCKPASWELCS